MQITFLGTSSGGGPSSTRNCSSLVANVVGDGTLWMVGCAEGTTRQFFLQPRGRDTETLRTQRVTKTFVTHMHADHVMGIVPFLRHVLFPPAIVDGSEAGVSHADHLFIEPPRIEIYGPADTYAVHELLTPQWPRTPCDAESLHSSECPGLDFLCDKQGFWQAFVVACRRLGDIVVDAGPISHRDPCIGYIIREPQFPNRKLVILGDTYDASAIEPLLRCPPPSLLIHEATDACIPTSVDPQARRNEAAVQEKVLARGHSTPAMAGEFAKRIGARGLVLNHIGSRFPARQLKHGHDMRLAVVDEISRQASDAWSMGYAQVAFDFMRVGISPPSIPAIEVEKAVATVAVAESSSSYQVNTSDTENGARSIGRQESGETEEQRGQGRRGRGWRKRRDHSGDSGQRRNDGKVRMRNKT